ncbi:MAG: isoprenoid biosynthesis glyoxalase ElbB [Bacteroidota bacterium]
MKKFAVILAGNGVLDGAEIQEAVLTLLAIDKLGATYSVFAPDINQHHVIDHLHKTTMNETRNVLIESARVSRGKIQPLSEYNASEFDALVLPGGFGVAKNLCTYAFDGIAMKIIPEIETAILQTRKLSKPIGALCISPVMLAKLIPNVTITIGTDETTEQHVEKMGAINIRTKHGDVVVDGKNNIFTTPCYMLDTTTISQVAEGAENLIKEILERIPN